jgi:hypothetical protein
LIKKGSKERSKKIGRDSGSQMLAHMLQPPLLYPLISCKEEKGVSIEGILLEMAAVTRGRIAVVQKGSFFFLSLSVSVSKLCRRRCNSLTELHWLEGKWEQEGNFGKYLFFVGFFFFFSLSSKVFLLFSCPAIVARSQGNCCICVLERGGMDIG